MLQGHCTPPTYCYSIFWGLNAIQPRDRKYALDGDFYSERIFDHDPWSKILVQGQCAFSTSRYILMKLTQTRLDKRQYAPEKILNIKKYFNLLFPPRILFLNRCTLSTHWLSINEISVRNCPKLKGEIENILWKYQIGCMERLINIWSLIMINNGIFFYDIFWHLKKYINQKSELKYPFVSVLSITFAKVVIN